MTYVENDPDDHSSNPSSAPPFSEVAASHLSRRTVLRGGVVAAALGFISAAGAAHPAGLLVGGAGTAHAAPGGSKGKPGSLLGFTAIPTTDADVISIADGYTADVLIPWGTPIRSGGPAWAKDGSNTAAEQAQQVGMHHDGMHFFPIARGPEGNRRGLLVLNHEYVAPEFLYPEGPLPMTRTKVDKALAAHGVTVIEVAFDGATWQAVDSPRNRRITGDTPVTFSGPVAHDHPALQANGPARGTLNNCSHGVTPWGTYLACEENWNGYFGTTDPTWAPSAEQARYGVNAVGFGYGWYTADPRFDVARNPNEVNRFGWCVEIDPFDPASTPVKRTALGRIKHEGATFTESRGHVVVYTGDDQNGDYVYKYVSAEPWRRMVAQGRSPLDDGTLYVGRFDDDGTGRWLPLVHGTGPLTVAGGWADQADVLLRTRQAADAVGATPMDRPEWVAVHPRTNDVYLTLTNGSGNPAAVNSDRDPNPYGHIIRWTEDRSDNTATRFRWDIFLLAGDPVYDPSVDLDDDSIFGSPDGLWIDDDGRMWIQTDISNSSQNRADRGYDRIGNNAMLAADPATGDVRRFLVGPRGCEITGVITTPDRRTMFINVQHPGENTPGLSPVPPTSADPQTVSSWPDHDPAGRPRSATVVIRKRDGGVIGT